MKKIHISLFLFFVLLLSACIPGGFAISPEDAVTQELLRDPAILSETVRLHQSQPWRESEILLVSFMSNQDNQKWSCEAVYQVERSTFGWRISGSGSGCGSPPSTESVVNGSGTQGDAPNNLSYAYGLVRLNTAASIEITWEDGFTQRLPMINGSYLALRDGLILSLSEIKVLDASETVIHEIEISTSPLKTP